MNTQKTVFNRLFSEPKKTELETHKVELGLIDDLNKALEDSETIVKELKDSDEILNRNYKSLERREKELPKRQAKSEKLFTKMREMEQKFELSQADYKEAESGRNSTVNGIESTKENIERLTKKRQPQVKKAQRQIAIFEKNISKANKMAQDLGVKLPIAKYQKAQDKLKTLI